MKPFNLADALAGKPVITRDGMKVIRLIELPEAKPKSRLVAVLEDGETATFHEGGRYYSMRDSSLDLFMAPAKKEGWINLYPSYVADSVVCSSCVHHSQQEAKDKAEIGVIATVKIEWEE